MEISEVVNTQLVFPALVVGLVLICAVLVFVFGFKSVEDFPFDKLATVADDRKPAGKKRKVKDKKSASNGQATVVSETKQKSHESPSTKVVTAKAKPVEKSPAKDVPKTSSKPEKKPAKTETSPLKDTKNLKETNKITDDAQKQKAKEVAGKQQKDQKSNKQSKSKGKENVDVKNKKNTEKSKIKNEEKPKDFDEGEWEQAFSRKDKKNRKPATSEEDNMVEKSVKMEAASPGKKKKVEKRASEPVPAVEPVAPSPPLPEVLPPQEASPEATKDKPKKEKEQKKEKPKPAEEAPVVESGAVNVESEGEGKAAKKKKKKPAAKESVETVTAPPAAAQVVEERAVPQEPPTKTKPAESKPAEEPQTDNAPVFDELGDTWKEAKTQKKASKKKVRKAE